MFFLQCRKTVFFLGVFFIGLSLIVFAATTVSADQLDPSTIPKYVTPLVIPPAMPFESKDSASTRYQIAAKQFQPQILPPGYPTTQVFGYGDATGPAPGLPGTRYHYPAYTVEVRSEEKVQVKWINGLADDAGNFISHFLPIDPTLHWANPPGPRDHRPEFVDVPGAYKGPVPIITHLHGAHVPPISDGNPEAWYLPAAKNIPADYFTRGTFYDSVLPAESGTAWFEYPNTQRATTLWYHDHTLGMTRLNVYAGLAGFWLIRDSYEDSLNLPGPAPRAGDPAGTKYYEIPIVVQDRSFNTDGSLFYPDSRDFFGDYEGPFIPGTNLSPIWNPEFFGNAVVVNGNTWPFLQVEPRKYRFRFLNGCNSRFLIMKVVSDPLAARPVSTALTFSQIGNDGGLIPNGPVTVEQLLVAPAERADVIIDFSAFAPGTELYLINEGPDEPFGGFPVEVPASSATTGQVMKFSVGGFTGIDSSRLPAPGSLNPALPVLGPVAKTRDLTLNEIAYVPQDAPVEAHLGTAENGPMGWEAHMTETPMLGDTEVWRLINLTADAHPIHLHLVQFEVVGRFPFDVTAYAAAQHAYIDGGKMGTLPDPLSFATGDTSPPNSWEAGRKDTVISNPGEVTMVKAKFDLPGLFVWHCHILEHEDNEMMRPYMVMEGQCASFDPATNNLHVPCLEMGDQYSLDLSLANNNPLQFSLADITAISGGSQCASYNPLTGILHLPCAEYFGLRYSADLSVTGTAPYTFELFGYSQLP
ncbi:MAG: bilirubin oxidase [Nitrospirae bacterium]|nr:MAG: bilirubin oxidase [Nitrospirota bacterium]